MKKILLAITATLALFAGRSRAEEAAVPLVNLVGDNSSLVIYVTDMPALVKTWPGTPWMKMWRDDQVQKYFAPLRAQLKVDEWDERCKANTGYTMAGLLDFATGEALFVMPDLGAVIDAAKNKTAPPLLVAVAIGDNGAKIEKLIADDEAKDKEKKYTETTEAFNGVTLHIVGVAAPNATGPQTPGIWAMAGGVFYVSPSKAFLEETLAAAKQGGHDDALGKSDGFIQMRQRAGAAQLILYANLKAMYPAAQKAIAQQKAQGAGPPAISPFDPSTILRALGLDAANELYVAANIGATSTEINSGLTYSERRGLAKLVEYSDGAPTRPQFVPGKCFSVSSARFSIKNFYATLEGMLGDISPLFSGMFQGYVKSFNDRLGLDLKRDLIGNLGDQLIVASALDEAAPADAPIDQRLSQFYAISLESDQAFTAAVESIKRGLFGEGADKAFEKRSYLGHDIYTYAPPQPPAAEGEPSRPAGRGFSYAVADHWVFLGIGSASLLENALQGLDGKQASFWDKDEVKRNLLADLPDNTRCLSYVDLGKIIPTYFNVFVQGMETSRKMAAMRAQRNPPGDGTDQADPAEPNKPMVDDSAKPDASTLAKYWGYSRAYGSQDANGTYSTGRIIYPNNP
jgi:hypothetical protein